LLQQLLLAERPPYVQKPSTQESETQSPSLPQDAPVPPHRPPPGGQNPPLAQHSSLPPQGSPLGRQQTELEEVKVGSQLITSLPVAQQPPAPSWQLPVTGMHCTHTPS
jgi:hypothetical protein